MKKIILLPALLLCLAVAAQDKLPSFGKIDKADLEMTDCSFDPGAEAVVMISVGEVNVTFEGNGLQMENKYRIRIKILKENGVHWAQIKLRYYSKDGIEYISRVSGVSFNLDGTGNIQESKLEKEAIFDKPLDKTHAEISFAMPNVKVGTVFEYKYSKIRSSFGNIPTWSFQQSIPVRYSAYNVRLPDALAYTSLITKRQEMIKKEGETNADGIWYYMNDIPGLKEEPYSFGRDNYIQRIEFQITSISMGGYYKEFRNSWPKIIDELLADEDFGGELKKNIRGTDDLYQQLVLAGSVRNKVRLVYNYVQQNMQWNDNYAIFSRNGIKDAWDKKNANIADINLILLNLLRYAGVNAKPLLASTKDNGTINVVYPFINQFNCVMAYVKDGDDEYIMNAADKYNPFDQVPYDVLYTNAVVIDKDKGGIIALNSDKKFENKIFFTCSTDDSGKVSGRATLTSTGYARNIRMHTYKTGELKGMLEDNEGITIKIDSLSLKNAKDELSPLEQYAEFSGTMQTSGDYLFLPFTLFTGLGKNPFVKDTRVMDIDFNFPKSYIVTGSYILSDKYEVNGLPRNVKMIMPDTSIVLTRVIQQSENIINFRFTLDFAAPGYTAEGYPYIKEFFKKMYDILEERIVLKKK
jgi:hypothetical protein